MLRYSVSFLIFFILSSSGLFSQPEIKGVYTRIPPEIDGYLNDDVWEEASSVDDFFQQLPRNGEAVTEKTEFLFLFDRNNIYVGIRWNVSGRRYMKPGLR